MTIEGLMYRLVMAVAIFGVLFLTLGAFKVPKTTAYYVAGGVSGLFLVVGLMARA